MTKLLDEAIAQVRTLPEHRQDELADALFAHLANDSLSYRLTPEQEEEVKRVQQNLRNGVSEPLSAEAMNAFWKSCGL